MMNAELDVAVLKIFELANEIYESVLIPEAMMEAELIVIPRREDAIEYEAHRTLSILDTCTKLPTSVEATDLNQHRSLNITMFNVEKKKLYLMYFGKNLFH